MKVRFIKVDTGSWDIALNGVVVAELTTQYAQQTATRRTVIQGYCADALRGVELELDLFYTVKQYGDARSALRAIKEAVKAALTPEVASIAIESELAFRARYKK